MTLGDVFYWLTNRAKGYALRAKFHIYICPPDHLDGHTFLLINTVSWGNDLKIGKSDYPFLDYDSFVGCNGVFCYSENEISAMGKSPVGRINKKDLKALFNILADPHAMEAAQAKRLCNALKAAF